MSKHPEEILCLHSGTLDLCLEETPSPPKGLPLLTSAFAVPGSLSWIPRDEAEKMNNYRQVIPYGIVCANGHVYCYTRGKSGGEKGLHNQTSIGFGGHVELIDMARSLDALIATTPADSRDVHLRLLTGALMECLKRELAEELNIKSPFPEAKPAGRFIQGDAFIIRDDTPVESRHIGVVILCVLDDGTSVQAKESCIENLFTIPVDDVRDGTVSKEIMDSMETWSVESLNILQTYLKEENPPFVGFRDSISYDEDIV